MKRVLLLCIALAMLGRGVAYADPRPATTIVASSNIVTATTTQVFAASSSPTLIYWLGVMASGANSTDTFQFEYSTVANCASGNTLLSPTGQVAPAAAGNVVLTFGGGMGNAAQQGLYSASPVPFTLPAGNNLCVVTAGTTIALYALVLY